KPFDPWPAPCTGSARPGEPQGVEAVAMPMERRERIEEGPALSHFDDPLDDQWRTRMSWSMLIAGVLHGALFGLWPVAPAASAEEPAMIAMDEPVWITPYEAGGDAGLGDDAITVAGPVLPPAPEGAG